MPIVSDKRIWKIRRSFVIPLPPDWVTTFSLDRRDKATVRIVYDGALLVIPPGKISPEDLKCQLGWLVDFAIEHRTGDGR